jgi:hypothetical protein
MDFKDKRRKTIQLFLTSFVTATIFFTIIAIISITLYGENFSFLETLFGL